MTPEQIKSELAYRLTQKYLIYLAMQEIMLDNYEDCKWLIDYDRDLLTKHKNMVASLKRNAVKAYRFLENYDPEDKTIKQFHSFVQVFEALHSAIDEGGSKYADLLDEIDELLIKYGYREESYNPSQQG
jgi:hypothetical protein